MRNGVVVREPARALPRGGFRLWHLLVLVVIEALISVDIQSHVRHPGLFALALAGYAGYGALAWLVWSRARRFRMRLRPAWFVAAYAVVMAALFLVATATYLVIEYEYLTRR